MLKITEIYVFVAQDKDDQDEGIIGFQSPDGSGWMPMVGADFRRVKDLKIIADKISLSTGKPYKILKFDNREEIYDSKNV